MLSSRAEADCGTPFLSNYYLDCLEFRQTFEIRPSQFQFEVVSF